MPKKRPQPLWREQTRCYYVQLGKKKVRLDPDETEAWRLYHEIMAKPPEARVVAPVAPTLVVEVLDLFLDWTGRHKAARTYAWYRENIQRFFDRIPKDLTVADLKPFHVTRALDEFPHWSNNTKNDFIAALKRAFNWAADEELIDRSPVARVKKPAREAREMVVSPAEYAQVMEAIREPNFRDLIELSWETRTRVQELRHIEVRFLDPDSSRVVFPPKQSKGKKYHRVIYLTERAMEILRRLVEAHRSGPILLNSAGKPWNKDSINCGFCRLQLALDGKAIAEAALATDRPDRFKKTGIEPGKLAAARDAHRESMKQWREGELRRAREHGKKYHLGAFRKGFATEALKAGVDTVTVAHLLGHRDAGMVSRVYGHVQQDPEHMLNAARWAKKP